MSESSTPTMTQIVEQMPNYFQPEKAGSITATYQFDLSDGGAYWLRVADGQASVGEGTAANANVTMTAKGEDYVKIFTGRLDPMIAFMQGKLKVKGDMGLATKMQSMFKRPS